MPTLTPARWQQVKEIFQQAADLPSAERALFLAQIAPDDEALRAEVAKLLAADEQAEAFLESSPLPEINRVTNDGVAGQTIGNYRLLRELGRGGMGTVYLAERDDAQFRQQVAIKIIRRGMDTEDILHRFRTERQILASLNHPNIARLLDGGSTPDGRPYYVMEYIEGRFIDDYCNEQQLSLADRLKLFRQACAAVHYAHQHLVIHRDLKPSNILVTAAGEVKLLDFGIAKLLTPDDPHATATNLGMMTPAYASPEQVRGETVTTAADVYALGVLLYELLSGHSPYRLPSETVSELTRAICEQEPVRPSLALTQKQQPTNGRSNSPIRQTPSAIRHLQGDLDNITLMALRKDPERRYASVEQFSEDLRRYLDGLPVSARPDTFRYRAGKFVRRNRSLTSASVIVLLTLLGGIAATWRQARIAEYERALAQQRFEDVRQLANAFVFKYHDELAKLPGSTTLREMMVTDARDYLLRLARDARGDTALQLELAQAWLRMGDVLGKPYLSNLGQTGEALKSYQQALLLAQQATQSQPQNNEARRMLALVLQNIGQAETRSGNYSSALQNLQQAAQLLGQLTQTPGANQEALRALANVQIALGDAAIRQPNGQSHALEAITHYQQALALDERLLQATPADKYVQRMSAIAHQRLGVTLFQNRSGTNAPQQFSEALAHHRRSTELFEHLAAEEPNNLQRQRDLVDEYAMKAEAQAQHGDAAGALADCRKGIALFERLIAADPQNAEAKRDLAMAWYVASNVLQSAGQHTAAVSAMLKSLHLLEELTQLDPANSENLTDLTSGYGRLSGAYASLQQPAQAAAAMRRAAEYQRRLRALQR